MNTEIIKHKHLQNIFLKREMVTKNATEVYTLSSSQKPRSKASYIKYEGKFIGVFSSVQGPVLFINSQEFLFTDPSWNVTLQQSNKSNIFTLTLHDKVIFTASYQPPQLDDLDPWSDIESVDLFFWIVAKRNNQELIQMWTSK